MIRGQWTAESIPWHLFEPKKVDKDLLGLVKGASLVESNAADYVTYLRNVFSDNPELADEIRRWGGEEKLHGDALRRWCEMADPSFDFAGSMERFVGAYRIPLEAPHSVRGSRSQELVARCVVETGTTAFYVALRDAAEEPVLREICRRIAGDEVRHFHFFLKHLDDQYAKLEKLGRIGRFKTIAERVLEVSDAELTFAYFAANLEHGFDPSRLREYSRRYLAIVAQYYNPKHLESSIRMLGRTVGLPINRWMATALSRVLHGSIQLRFRERDAAFRELNV